MQKYIALILFSAGVSQSFPAAQYPTPTPILPPRPFKYEFASGRYPGGPPDRYTQSEGDAAGVIRGGYAYLDPNHKWQKVEYVADENGFHVDPSVLPVANLVAHPRDTVAVAQAKANHKNLYEQIALRNSQIPVAPQAFANVETAAVASHREAFHKQFDQIAAEHARIAAEHELLAELEKKERELAKEQRLTYL
eukprot:TRINITY_DN2930_c1_g1_i4.p1 TRINITY_DN2930_c1_g1~~TRINITY_DN2930_c1_g1_i4.p1  ORF type:complete len:194 (-),score=57.64 TRINITY_DN2930_c1_g1_i4:113-694(-)